MDKIVKSASNDWKSIQNLNQIDTFFSFGQKYKSLERISDKKASSELSTLQYILFKVLKSNLKYIKTDETFKNLHNDHLFLKKTLSQFEFLPSNQNIKINETQKQKWRSTIQKFIKKWIDTNNIDMNENVPQNDLKLIELVYPKIKEFVVKNSTQITNYDPQLPIAKVDDLKKYHKNQFNALYSNFIMNGLNIFYPNIYDKKNMNKKSEIYKDAVYSKKQFDDWKSQYLDQMNQKFTDFKTIQQKKYELEMESKIKQAEKNKRESENYLSKIIEQKNELEMKLKSLENQNLTSSLLASNQLNNENGSKLIDRDRIEQLNHQIKQLNKENQALNEKINELNIQYDDQKISNVQLFEKKLNACKEETKLIEKERNELKVRLKESQTNIQKCDDVLTKSMQQKNKQLEACNDQIANIKTTLNQKQFKINDLELQIEDFKKEIQECKQMIEKYELFQKTLNEKILQLKKENKENDTKLSNLKKISDDLEKNIEERRNELMNHKLLVHDINNLIESNKQYFLNGKKESPEFKNEKSLEQLISTLNQNINENNTFFQNKIKAFKDDNDTLKQSILNSQNEKKQLIESHQEQINLLKDETETLKTEKQEKINKIDQLDNEIKDLNDKNNALNDQKNIQEEKVKELEEEWKKIKDSMNGLDQHYLKNKESINQNQLISDYEKYKNIVLYASKEIEKLKQNIDNLNQQIEYNSESADTKQIKIDKKFEKCK